ncbi:MAG: LptA/OstA family protein [Pseudomonadota bacterium]|nr:LptA/OstA family protein [Pseudomonadota bacterium]
MSLQRTCELRRVLLALAAAILPMWASALPEDDAQEIVSDDYASIELALDEGEVVQKAHADRPTCITQGSRVICGAEIRLQRADDGSLRKVTAIGTPARFQQKPSAEQEVVHFSGSTLVFDNAARLLTIDGDAKFSQGKNELAHQHMEYHLDTRRLSATGDANSLGNGRFTPPAPAEGN